MGGMGGQGGFHGNIDPEELFRFHRSTLEACLDFIDLGRYLVIGQVATRLQGASILAR